MTTTGAPSGTTTDERPGDWISLAPYGFSRYEIYSPGGYGLDEGQWPVRHRTKGTYLKVTLGTHGYPQVKPYNDQDRQETRTVHGLIMLAYAGWPKPGEETRHLNSDPLDYRWAPGSEEETKAAGGNLIYGTKEENSADRLAALAAAGRAGNGRPMVPPKPDKHCVRCGAVFTTNGRRCHECVVWTGVEATALLRSNGGKLGAAAEQLDYPSVDGLHTLAVKYGGYGKECHHWSHKVRGWFRRNGDTR